MSLLDRLARRLRALAHRDRLARESDDEMRHHLELETRDLIAAGRAPADAEREARIRFGGIARFRDEGREARGVSYIDDAIRDVRLGVRTLRRSPGFATVAVLTLALGIGATTAVFTAVNGVLLRPLPYVEPGRLVRILGTTARSDRGTVAYLDVLDYREQARSVLEEVAAYDEWSATLTGGDTPERLEGASVTSPFFRVLGVRPWRGRFFVDAEDEPGHERAVVLSHELWQRRFGGSEAVVGTEIEVNGSLYRVVGITPPDFEDPGLTDVGSDRPMLWRVTPGYFNPRDSQRSSMAFAAVARLTPGATLERAQAELSAVAARLEQQYPDANTGRGVRLIGLQDQITAPVRPSLLLLLGATLLLILIACTNVANLLLARAAERQREMAVRAALGAGRGRLVRQLLAENFVVALAGGVLGIVIAERASSAMVSLAGRAIARADQVHMDARVLLFAAVATCVTGLLFGLAPAFQGSFGATHASLKDGARGSEGRGVQRMRQLLVAAQVAISLVLLASAALLLRSLSTLQDVDPGFQPAGVLTLRIDPTGERYANDSTVMQLYDIMLERLAGLPGVRHAAAVDILPMSGGFNGMGIRFLDRDPVPSADDPSVETRGVSPDFFAALGVPVLRGRAFTRADRPGAPTVAIVDETMANRFWPNENPIGKRIAVFSGTVWEVVGVSGAVRQFTLDQEPAPTLYLPRPQVQQWLGASGIVLLRADGDPLRLAGPARETIAAIDRTVPISEVRPITDVVGATLAAERLRTVLLGVFGAIAFIIAAVGMYGVVAYGVSRRTTEFGIRMALGARPGSIVKLVMRQSARPVVLGAAVGLVVALVVGRALSGWLFGISPGDPLAYAAATIVIAGAAFVAALVPARRATRVEPSAVLRGD